MPEPNSAPPPPPPFSTGPTGPPPPPAGNRAQGSTTTTGPLQGIQVADVNFIRNIPVDNLFGGAPDGTGGVAAPEYGAEWWFLYFWKEAQARWGEATPTQKSTVAEFFDRAFTKPSNWSAIRFNAPHLVPRGPLSSAISDAGALRRYLQTTLEIGFGHVDVGGNDTSSDLADHCRTSELSTAYELYWRGENRRGIDELQSTGYSAQANDYRAVGVGDLAREEGRAVTINIRQAWHPYSQPDVSSKLWFRRGQNDNCLYSAVSLAKAWESAVTFPKIDQTNNFLTNNRRQVWLMGQTAPRPALVSRSRVALIVAEGMVFDTQSRQQATPGDAGFPEVSVQKVKPRNVLGMLEFLRVHHGDADSDGFTAFVNRSSRTLHVSLTAFAQTFGDYFALLKFKGRVQETYDDAFLSRRTSLRWVDRGFERIHTPDWVQQISRVQGPDGVITV